MDAIAGEYFGAQYTYFQTFEMFENFKNAFIQIDGLNENAITISCPSTIASVNAFYGAIDADKIVSLTGPGFLHAYTEKYTKELNSHTVVVFQGFLTDDLIVRLQKAGVKNLIITSITDYMDPAVKAMGTEHGLFDCKDFPDEYVRAHKAAPQGMELIRLKDFAALGAAAKHTYSFPYKAGKIAAYFLTGATTSQIPKCVKLYCKYHYFNYNSRNYCVISHHCSHSNETKLVCNRHYKVAT